MQLGKLAAVFCAAVTVITFGASAGAVDGTIEINQAKVLAAGGFPYVVSNPGSYRLTGNLTVPSTTLDAIDVKASYVTIDLNGFSIIGPNDPIAGGNGISSFLPGPSATSTTVENGTVTGFNIGVFVGPSSIVRNVHADGNSASGIRSFGNGCVFSGNTTSSGNNGIYCGGQACLISGNTVVGTTTGIVANDATTGYGGNVLKNTTNVNGGTSLGNNLCSGVVC